MGLTQYNINIRNLIIDGSGDIEDMFSCTCYGNSLRLLGFNVILPISETKELRKCALLLHANRALEGETVLPYQAENSKYSYAVEYKDPKITWEKERCVFRIDCIDESEEAIEEIASFEFNTIDEEQLIRSLDGQLSSLYGFSLNQIQEMAKNYYLDNLDEIEFLSKDMDIYNRFVLNSQVKDIPT